MISKKYFFFTLFCLIQGIHLIKYKNPVLEVNAPDPSIIKAHDNYYYAYVTGEKIYRSSDLVSWKFVSKAFQGVPRPSFLNVNAYWAPCINIIGKKYVLYYALSIWGQQSTAGIGVAYSNNPEGPFKIINNGKLFTSSEVRVKNSIDPFFFQHNGKKYLFWGSFNGIWGIELNADGLSVKNLNSKNQIAGTYFEAPYIYKRGGYFYLFASIGSCCEGDNSKYQTVVGRSTRLLGPYLNKEGGKMLHNKYTVLLSGNNKFVGPGHNSRIIEDKNKKTWMLYHAYIRGKSSKGRTLCLDEVKWTSDGWPYFEGNGPSSTLKTGPLIK